MYKFLLTLSGVGWTGIGQYGPTREFVHCEGHELYTGSLGSGKLWRIIMYLNCQGTALVGSSVFATLLHQQVCMRSRRSNPKVSKVGVTQEIDEW